MRPFINVKAHAVLAQFIPKAVRHGEDSVPCCCAVFQQTRLAGDLTTLLVPEGGTPIGMWSADGKPKSVGLTLRPPPTHIYANHFLEVYEPHSSEHPVIAATSVDIDRLSFVILEDFQFQLKWRATWDGGDEDARVLYNLIDRPVLVSSDAIDMDLFAESAVEISLQEADSIDDELIRLTEERRNESEAT